MAALPRLSGARCCGERVARWFIVGTSVQNSSPGRGRWMEDHPSAAANVLVAWQACGRSRARHLSGSSRRGGLCGWMRGGLGAKRDHPRNGSGRACAEGRAYFLEAEIMKLRYVPRTFSL
eukprot:CAMPEP_0170301792 /NCGR_PEP_ID=MMETSP0116_2-20130129/51163_1 /TAXON_ID=400756 /ORGANISM="Durinskia baltica, Strain CSIRO CS-38" /LENGTH=119 /DNA_ID=CAMNT_0010553629 /DNA_START=25 /DNA_END=384 /DNA_ORIENTATION=-